MSELIVAAAALVGGLIAGVAGFGIGSVLTPAFTLELPMRMAVVAVSIPHICATAFRLWLLRANVDRKVLLSFGLLSAAGGLAGALLQRSVANRTLVLLLAALLIFAGLAAVTGTSKKLRLPGGLSWLGGALSGLLGGLVGNQGGIRAAALVGSGLSRDRFVATATATALMVDLARVPVYLWTSGEELRASGMQVVIAVAGVLAGTWIGYRLLTKIPESIFQRVVGALLCCLGAYMAVQGL